MNPEAPYKDSLLKVFIAEVCNYVVRTDGDASRRHLLRSDENTLPWGYCNLSKIPPDVYTMDNDLLKNLGGLFVEEI